MSDTEFLLTEIEPLINWDDPHGECCLISDKITKEGFGIGYMYREEPDEGIPDSGWRFLAGNEDEAYLDNPDNLHIFVINTACNYDKSIMPYLNAEFGTKYIKTTTDTFEIDDGTKEVFVCKLIEEDE